MARTASALQGGAAGAEAANASSCTSDAGQTCWISQRPGLRQQRERSALRARVAAALALTTLQAVALVEQRPGLKVAAVSRFRAPDLGGSTGKKAWSLIAAAGNLEALRRGIPIVATYHSGIPEVVKDGINGFLVQEFDYAAMGDKIELLLTNKMVFEEIKKNLRTTENEVLWTNNKRVEHLINQIKINV